MSWSRFRLPALGLVLTLSLSGCGYTPLYGTATRGPETLAALSRVQIATVDAPTADSLVGRDVRDTLLDQVNPNGEPDAPLQRLEIGLSESLGGLLVQPDAAITRYNYTLVAAYKLIDIQTGKVALQGQVIGVSAYNVVASQYATVVARRDAQRRAAESVSNELSLRLALYFKK